MTALTQPVAVGTPNARESVADDVDRLPIPGNFATVYVRVDPQHTTKLQFSANNTAPWYHGLSWQCAGTTYALFITFILPSGMELGVTSTTKRPWPWFSDLAGSNQYICVPWVTSETTYHFTPVSAPEIEDPQIVVTPA